MVSCTVTVTCDVCKKTHTETEDVMWRAEGTFGRVMGVLWDWFFMRDENWMLIEVLCPECGKFRYGDEVMKVPRI